MKLYLLSFLLSFALCFCFCLIIIPILRKLKAGQNILSYVKEHKNKSGTPTMGGIAFIFASVLSFILLIKGADRTVILCLVIGVAYMLIGLLDDFLKMKHKENLGLKAWQKLLFQVLVAIFVGIYCMRAQLTKINIPFINAVWDIGWWILPFCVFVFLATVNAVNLTDGLDGLAGGACLPFFTSLGIVVLLQNGNSAFSLLCFCLTGALIAYLFFNTSPASVFMGDTGSLSLGGFASALAIFSGNGLYIPILGIVFVFSVISVLLQVIYYKATGGKRIFLMAPAHHHFQEKGYSESKISYAYFTVSLLMGILCILFLIN